MDEAALPAASGGVEPGALHATLLTLDSHIDIPWPYPGDPFAATSRRVDLRKMRAGSLRAGCFAAYVPQGKCDPAGHAAAFDRASAMLGAIGGMGRREDGIEGRICTTADAVEFAHASGAIAVIPAVENGYAVGEDLGTLARLRNLGACYLTLTHNGHNALADSSNPRADLGDGPVRHHGLSPLGREAVAELNRLGMLVDVSHVSREAMLQAARLSATPVVATHSCVHALCPVPRNLDDLQLDALRDTGGLIQITAVPSFLRMRGREQDVTVGDYVDHIDYVVQRCGLAHVGISSDFDGGGGIAGWRDASESPNLTAELQRRGYGAAEIALLWGGNFLRLMRGAEAAAS